MSSQHRVSKILIKTCMLQTQIILLFIVTQSPQVRTQPLSIQCLSRRTHGVHGLSALGGKGPTTKTENQGNAHSRGREVGSLPTTQSALLILCQVQIPPAPNTAQEWRYIPHLCKHDPCKKASCPSDPPLLWCIHNVSASSNNLFFLSHLAFVVLNNSLYWPTGLRKIPQRTTTTQWKLRIDTHGKTSKIPHNDLTSVKWSLGNNTALH